MRYSTALVAVASLTTSASAFLITPDLAKAASEASESWKSLILGTEHTLDLECPGCAFVIETERKGLSDTNRDIVPFVESNLRLVFTAVDGQLRINNASMWPTVGVPFITAKQYRIDNGESSMDMPVDYLFKIEESIAPNPRFHMGKFGRMRPEEDAELIPVEFTVIGLEGSPIKPQSAKINLIRHQDGALTIVRVQAQDFRPDSDGFTVVRATADEMLAIVPLIQDAKDDVHEVDDIPPTHTPAGKPKRPCHGGWGRFDKDGAHGGPHHGHRGGRFQHHGAYSVMHILHRILNTFIIPAFLGIIGGLAASALGMLVGQSIACLWFRYGRGGRRGGVDNMRVYEIDAEEAEKLGLIHDEDLPVYEHVPEYEEAPKYEEVAEERRE